ncbi:MAG TPA: Tol-Pal system beta propeller repeat protein TolB [Steroidobacteraceae bacterium]|nr:Tol-Pal system beta propeller repeat protein TolB [Steroidobacteraceae bacterium]
MPVRTPARARALIRRAAALLAMATGVCAAFSTHAQLNIVITSGVTDPIPIAIVPFGNADPTVPTAGADVAAVIQSDLTGSGRFKAMPRSAMRTTPTKAGDVVLADWRAGGNDYVVVGNVSPIGGGQLAVDFQLLSTLSMEQLANQRFTGPPTALRDAAHRVSNAIYQKILGIRGAFDTRIAYVAVQGTPPAQHFQLVVADADGANPHVVLDSRQPVMSPSWSPDGNWLAYASFENRRESIYVQQVRTGERRLVSARLGANTAPSFSPDGRKLALTLGGSDGNLDIFVLDLATQQLTRITDDPAIDTEPVWAPDGRSLFFTSDRGGGPQIYQVGLGPGARPKRITFEGSYNADPSVSPNGAQLAMMTQDGGSYHIAIMDLASSTVRVLSHGHLDKSPSFAPNGNTLIYAATENGRGVLQRVSVDGVTSQRLESQQGDVRDPVWGPFSHP